MKRLLAALGSCSIAFAVGCGDTAKTAPTTTPPMTSTDPNFQRLMAPPTPPGGAAPTAGDAAADGSTPAKTDDAPKEEDKPAEAAPKDAAADAPKEEVK
jgi:hypothetical protein